MTNIQVDNDALKAKIRSCSVLTTFYHETQREIANLSQQLYSRDNVISDLKARLGKYERTYINVEGEEPVAIGPSKSLLESLCKEICKLKQKLKESETEGNQQLEASKLVSIGKHLHLSNCVQVFGELRVNTCFFTLLKSYVHKSLQVYFVELLTYY